MNPVQQPSEDIPETPMGDYDKSWSPTQLMRQRCQGLSQEFYSMLLFSPLPLLGDTLAVSERKQGLPRMSSDSPQQPFPHTEAPKYRDVFHSGILQQSVYPYLPLSPQSSPEMIEVITEDMDTLTAARFLSETHLDTWALRYAEMAVEENPNSYEANLVYAQTLPAYPREVEGEKIAAYYKTLEINPDTVDALVGLGSMIYRNRPSESLEYLQRAVELDSLHGIAFYQLGKTLERLGRYEEAQKAYRKGIELGLSGLAVVNLRAIEEGNPRIKPIEYEQQESQEIPYK